MTETHIRYRIDGDAATILLEPPEGKPPTLDDEVLDELERCMDRLREGEPRIVLVRSASERFFCVGANINVLQTYRRGDDCALGDAGPSCAQHA